MMEGERVMEGGKADLYTDLWLACAGSTVHVLRAGEKVLYFPQGHIEQVEAYMNQEGQMEMPIDLPYKILCSVVHVQLMAEALTDEVFAQVTLLPEAKQGGLSSEDGTSLSLPRRTHVCPYSKILTQSDTNMHGVFSVPKRLADECLPPMDTSQQRPSQELVAKDLHGCEWRFRHIYRGQPKRHLLTSGWSKFVNSKKLVTGDACIFLSGENGELRVGIRRASLQNNASTSVKSSHNMQEALLACAFQAISTGARFTVNYRPWTSPSEFIIPYYQFMKSVETDCSVGTRIRMQFEGEDFTEHRCPGTVVGIEDVDGIRWHGSKWRCLKVKWDTASDASIPPERVSPWNVEPIGPTNILPKQKRPRPLDPLSPGLSILVGDGSGQSSFEYTPQRQSVVLQSQELGAIGSHESANTSEDLDADVAAFAELGSLNFNDLWNQFGFPTLHDEAMHVTPALPTTPEDLEKNIIEPEPAEPMVNVPQECVPMKMSDGGDRATPFAFPNSERVVRDMMSPDLHRTPAQSNSDAGESSTAQKKKVIPGVGQDDSFYGPDSEPCLRFLQDGLLPADQTHLICQKISELQADFASLTNKAALTGTHMSQLLAKREGNLKRKVEDLEAAVTDSRIVSSSLHNKALKVDALQKEVEDWTRRCANLKEQLAVEKRLRVEYEDGFNDAKIRVLSKYPDLDLSDI